jgi:hypothetical protein
MKVSHRKVRKRKQDDVKDFSSIALTRNEQRDSYVKHNKFSTSYTHTYIDIERYLFRCELIYVRTLAKIPSEQVPDSLKLSTTNKSPFKKLH